MSGANVLMLPAQLYNICAVLGAVCPRYKHMLKSSKMLPACA